MVYVVVFVYVVFFLLRLYLLFFITSFLNFFFVFLLLRLHILHRLRFHFLLLHIPLFFKLLRLIFDQRKYGMFADTNVTVFDREVYGVHVYRFIHNGA